MRWGICSRNNGCVELYDGSRGVNAPRVIWELEFPNKVQLAANLAARTRGACAGHCRPRMRPAFRRLLPTHLPLLITAAEPSLARSFNGRTACIRRSASEGTRRRPEFPICLARADHRRDDRTVRRWY